MSGAAVDLPAELRRENVTVEQFVSPHEQPPEYVLSNTVITGTGEEPIAARIAWWRTHRAWRRWQDAVIEWGAERGLGRRDLMRLHLLPQRNWMPHLAARTGPAKGARTGRIGWGGRGAR